jgi:protein TonB
VETTRESEPARVVSTPTVAAHFALSAPVSVPVATAATLGSAQPAASSVAAAASAPLTEREVDVGPRLLAGPPAAYPASAEAAGVEASVPVELVIDTRGAVQSAVALGRVGYGLDEAALAAVRAYRFVPARRHGAPVAVRMRWVVRFELR